MTNKRRFAYLVLLINTVVWGLAAPIVKPALSFTTPERFLFYRFLVASVVSFPVVVWMLSKAKLRLEMYLKVIGLELLGTTLLLWIIYTALRLTTAIESSLIYSTSPLFVTAAGILFLGERESKREWKGLLLALLGTMIIVIGPVVTQGGSTALSGSLIGNGLMLLQNILWAGYLTLVKTAYRRIPKFAVTGISFWVGLVSFFLIALPSGNPITALASEMSQPSVMSAVVYMAVFGSIIGATTYLVGQNLIEISEATVFTYGQVLVALPAAMIWLGEPVQPLALMGLVITAIGVYINEKRQ